MVSQTKLILLICILFARTLAFAGEGMWLPIFLKSLNEAEMKRMGMKISAEDIYSVNKGSLKDAIVHFGGGCTGEIISDKGLLLTNHHCGYGQIQRHSTLENNYLENGFWALTGKDELPNPDLSVTFIVRIEDVTEKVFKGITKKTKEEEKEAIINKNLDLLKQTVQKKSFEDVFVRSFFHGNQYFMFVTATFKDVRLVGAPPSSIGKFGADTDNWEWPRHTGDFALFRVYANANNEPAAYSPDNVPYKPKHFLPISMDGVAPGDFTMVFGFPGRTNLYQPSYGVEMTMNVLNPARIAIRKEVLGLLDATMRKDPQAKINYASKYASIANAYKKWIGENQGLERVGGLEKKMQYETEFRQAVQKNKKWRKAYSNVLPEMERQFTAMRPYAHARDVYDEVMGRNSEYIRMANMLNSLAVIYENNGPEAFKSRLASARDNILSTYGRIDGDTEQRVYSAVLRFLMDQVPQAYIEPSFFSAYTQSPEGGEAYLSQILAASFLAGENSCKEALAGEDVAVLYNRIIADPLVKQIRMLMAHYNEVVAKSASGYQAEIARLQKTYMEAQMKVFSQKRFFPDANSTMRVTYGNVEGYKPRDGVQYQPITYLSGVIEKYVPGDYEFDLPRRLMDLSKLKNFGPYADKTGDVPVCFLGSNHTTGGNSGSPAIDAHGNLIGLNFDRVWEGTMSDIHYDPSICRNIMVDVRYILFIIDKYANAGHLVKEMKLVYPKTGHIMKAEKVEMHERIERTVD
jgi:hypothetical protein